MTEQERAAELADEIKRKGLAFTGDAPHDLVSGNDEDIIVTALFLLAASTAGIAALRPGDEIDLGEFGTVVLMPKNPKPILTAGYYAACKFGIYEARAFDAAEAIYRAMLAAVKETGR